MQKSNHILYLSLLFVAALPGRAQQNVYGCPVQPRDSVFYSRVDSLPLLPQSSTYITTMGSASLTWGSNLAATATKSTSPSFNAQFNYTPGYNGTWRNPPFSVIDRQGGSLGGDYPADHHTIMVDSDTCTVWETYHTYVNPADGTLQTKTCGGRPCNVQSGFKYDGSSYALPAQGTTDAAGLPLLPLLWRGHEILDGQLNHPVRFTMGKYMIQAGNPTWPAKGTNGSGGASAPPYGTRFRLMASATIDLTGLTPQQQVYAQTLITALQRYGMVLADIGGTFNASVDNEAGSDPDVVAALNKVGSQIRPAQMEAVDLSSLKPTPLSYQAANADTAGPSILVGTPYRTYLNVQSGTKFQLQSWVNGPTTEKGVSWQITSGSIGTVTPDGFYTTPTSVTGVVSGVLKVTALADPTAYSTVYVRVIPSGPIRIAAGLKRGTITDGFGQTWLPNLFFRGGDTIYRAGDYPNWSLPSDPVQAAQIAIYQSTAYTYGNDQVARIVVPNGTYSVRLMFGQPYYGRSPSTCSPFPAAWHNNVSIELQQEVVVPNYDFGAGIDHACGVPVDLNLTTTVTNNVIQVALRTTVPDGSPTGTSPAFNGVEIIRTK